MAYLVMFRNRTWGTRIADNWKGGQWAHFWKSQDSSDSGIQWDMYRLLCTEQPGWVWRQENESRWEFRGRFGFGRQPNPDLSLRRLSRRPELCGGSQREYRIRDWGQNKPWRVHMRPQEGKSTFPRSQEHRGPENQDNCTKKEKRPQYQFKMEWQWPLKLCLKIQYSIFSSLSDVSFKF